MTVEEIYNKIASHMVEGIMYHDDFAKAYEFLGFWGFAACHDYHHFMEEKDYRELSHYYATHCFRLIHVENVPQPNIIPESWHKYKAQEVDVGTKRTALKELMTKWVDWEKETKKLYEEMYMELTNLREISAAIQVQKLIEDVDEELSIAQKKLLKLDSIGYDLATIMDWQDKLYHKYRKTLGCLFNEE